jgi:hypothetical protein
MSSFYVRPELSRPNSDSSMLELSNRASYFGKTEDPWFSATTVDSSSFLFDADRTISVLACIEQYTICNISYCTEPAGLYQITPSPENRPLLLSLSDAQWATYALIWKAAQVSSIGWIAEFRGAEILLAQDELLENNNFISRSLPSDQWKQEIKNLHYTGMALLQLRLFQYAMPPNNSLGQGLTTLDDIIQPNTTLNQALCRNIKARASNVSSFSLLGVLGIVVFGILVSIANYFLADVVFWYRRRRNKGEGYREKEWRVSELLHLQGRMFQARGIEWEGEDGDVPVTVEKGQAFRLIQVPLETEEDKSLVSLVVEPVQSNTNN